MNEIIKTEIMVDILKLLTTTELKIYNLKQYKCTRSDICFLLNISKRFYDHKIKKIKNKLTTLINGYDK